MFYIIHATLSYYTILYYTILYYITYYTLVTSITTTISTESTSTTTSFLSMATTSSTSGTSTTSTVIPTCVGGSSGKRNVYNYNNNYMYIIIICQIFLNVILKCIFLSTYVMWLNI